MSLAPSIIDSIENSILVKIPIIRPFFNPFVLFTLPVISPVMNVIVIIDTSINKGCISIFNKLKIENIRGKIRRVEIGINNNLIVLFMISPS